MVDSATTAAIAALVVAAIALIVAVDPDSMKDMGEKEILERLETGDVLAVWRPRATDSLIEKETRGSTFKNIDLNTFVPQFSDPSSYFPMTAAWECIMRADHCMHLLAVSGSVGGFHKTVDEIVVCAISPLAESGAVSWGETSELVKTWPQIFDAACEEIFAEDNEKAERLGKKRVKAYARLSILRAAYYTIMMRAAGDVGPGLTENARIDTALVYMA
ncbi:hypothetical protein P7C71_g5331, partial [Lecanoromycetidae sp. Uapishka_2]